MFGNILHRMIFSEMVKVFLLTLLVITAILVLAGILKEAPGRGLSGTQMLMLIPLIIPETLPFTVPSTMLFATCVVYGRMAHDNEILAIKAGGVHLLRIVLPGIVLGTLVSGGTMVLYYHVIPYTQYLLRMTLLEDAEDLFYTMLRNERQIHLPGFPYAIFVRGVHGWKLEEPILKRRDASGHYDLIVCAREGELRVDMSHRQILVRMSDGQLSKSNAALVHFKDQVWELPFPSAFELDNLSRPTDLTWPKLIKRRAELRLEEEALVAEISTKKPAASDPEAVKEVAGLEQKLFSVQQDIEGMTSEMQKRPAMALGCLCFVLIGCPVGIHFSRGDYLSTFVSCFLPITFLYYPLGICGFILARKGYIDSIYGLWTADVLLVVLSLVLYRRLLKN